MIERIKKYITSLEEKGIPQLSVNCVIFGFHEKTLKVIINKIDLAGLTGSLSPQSHLSQGLWRDAEHSVVSRVTPRKEILVLPGGYIGQTEDLTDAVSRIVKESTGLEKILFKQFAVFGDASRSFGKEFNALNKTLTPSEKQLFQWFSKRFVSICYLALVDFNKIELKPTTFLEAAQWLPVDQIKLLAMDHSDMVKSARETLIRELPHTPIASNLLPAKFILPELHALAEAVLGRPIDRPNFRRKILKSDLIVKVGTDDSGQRRPADLYKFKYGKKTNLNDEMKFGF